MSYRIVECRWDTGEHYRMLDKVDPDGTGMPCYWPTLYVSTQLRNTGRSVASMEAALGAIRVLLEFLDEHEIDIEKRILDEEYLAPHEVEALCDRAKVAANRTGTVSSGLHYTRLGTIATYLEWLAHTLLGFERRRHEPGLIDQMVQRIRARRPPSNNKTLVDKAPEDHVFNRLAELIQPSHPGNPFADERAAARNHLIILLLAGLGLRKGELLGVKVTDIDWSKSELTIHRRADDPEDPRTRQPTAKTRARVLELPPALLDAIWAYVRGARRRTKGANTHRYLLVGHRKGPHEGQPLTLAAVDKVFEKLNRCDPALKGLHAHALRHYWNWAFSRRVDTMPPAQRPTPEREAQIRCYMMGWTPGSASVARYNARHIKREAANAATALSATLPIELAYPAEAL